MSAASRIRATCSAIPTETSVQPVGWVRTYGPAANRRIRARDRVCAPYGREALAEVLPEMLDEAESERAARQILRDNALAFYALSV
jgi:hypothetical protein